MITKVPFIRIETLNVQNKHLQDVVNDPLCFWKNTYQNKCIDWLKDYYRDPVYLLDSCTEGMNVVALMMEISAGDEIVVPSFTHVSSILPFVNYGAVPVFVDVDIQNLCLDSEQVEAAITEKTRAIVAVNYGGWSPNYDLLQRIAKSNNLLLIEDNAHGLGSTSNHMRLGSFGDVSLLSFEKQKNINCQEGGGLILHNTGYQEKLNEVLNLGTNRKRFDNGEIGHYEWVSKGMKSSFTEFQAAFLWPQLLNIHDIARSREEAWKRYFELLKPLEDKEKIHLAPPTTDEHNGHIFYLIVNSSDQRNMLINHLEKQGVQAQFHYYPLHLSQFGHKNGRISGSMINTEIAGTRLIRLPMFNSITEEEQQYVVEQIYSFFNT